jgi:hypothetical protein
MGKSHGVFHHVDIQLICRGLRSICVQVSQMIDFVHGNMLFQTTIPEGVVPGDTLQQAVPAIWRYRNEEGAVTINTLVGLSQVSQFVADIECHLTYVGHFGEAVACLRSCSSECVFNCNRFKLRLCLQSEAVFPSSSTAIRLRVPSEENGARSSWIHCYTSSPNFMHKLFLRCHCFIWWCPYVNSQSGPREVVTWSISALANTFTEQVAVCFHPQSLSAARILLMPS